MLDSVLIFILFIGPLVFFHELGHFLFARLFGVRVETFSIGFGPKILSFKKGDTQYAVSLIPLGGYVKMFGDNILEKDEVPERERKYAYTYKSIWARFWIVFGGPLANFIMAFALFYFILLGGETAPRAIIGGNIKSDSFLSSVGFKPGDKITKLNGLEVINMSDIYSANAQEKDTFEILRGNESKTITISGSEQKEKFLKEFAQSAGSPLRQPLLVNSEGDFFLLSEKSSEVNWNKSLEEFFETSQESLWVIPVTRNAQKDEETNQFLNKDIEFNKSFEISFEKEQLLKTLEKSNLYPADLSVKSLVMSSPADKAGVLAGDIITDVNDVAVTSFSQISNLIQEFAKTGNITLKVRRKGETNKINIPIVPEKVKEDNSYRVGVYRRIDFVPYEMVKGKSLGLIESLPLALEKTLKGMYEVLNTFKKLIFGEASMNNLGGPLAIGKYATATFYNGLSQFFSFMAMMSINLGIINLFPIPVLDGGHIMFLFFEFLNRKPLSKKKMQVAYQVGFSILILILAVALVNDFSNILNG